MSASPLARYRPGGISALRGGGIYPVHRYAPRGTPVGAVSSAPIRALRGSSLLCKRPTRSAQPIASTQTSRAPYPFASAFGGLLRFPSSNRHATRPQPLCRRPAHTGPTRSGTARWLASCRRLLIRAVYAPRSRRASPSVHGRAVRIHLPMLQRTARARVRRALLGEQTARARDAGARLCAPLLRRSPRRRRRRRLLRSALSILPRFYAFVRRTYPHGYRVRLLRRSPRAVLDGAVSLAQFRALSSGRARRAVRAKTHTRPPLLNRFAHTPVPVPVPTPMPGEIDDTREGPPPPPPRIVRAWCVRVR